jgi:hypothetical protein
VFRLAPVINPKLNRIVSISSVPGNQNYIRCVR